MFVHDSHSMAACYGCVLLNDTCLISEPLQQSNIMITFWPLPDPMLFMSGRQTWPSDWSPTLIMLRENRLVCSAIHQYMRVAIQLKKSTNIPSSSRCIISIIIAYDLEIIIICTQNAVSPLWLLHRGILIQSRVIIVAWRIILMYLSL